jgi:hypothetical protein
MGAIESRREDVVPGAEDCNGWVGLGGSTGDVPRDDGGTFTLI